MSKVAPMFSYSFVEQESCFIGVGRFRISGGGGGGGGKV